MPPLYRRGKSLFAELGGPDYANEYMVLISISRGIAQGQILGGMSWGFGDDWIWQFRKVDENVPSVRRNVRFGAEVYTDSARAYSDLADTQIHRAIDHSTAYVEGVVHTNGLENFWALLKRSIRGTYIAVAPFHLFRYVAEQSFRFNERATNDSGRFLLALRGVVGRRLTSPASTAHADPGCEGTS